jgi:hypothetical protein
MAVRIGALVREGMDWDYLLRMAHRHRMAPLLYWQLDAACLEAVPESVVHNLQEHFRANSLRNLALTRELLRILKAFESQGIPVVPYKGPVLAASVYRNLALREFGDLDILVHLHDILRAEELMASLGYMPQHQLTQAQEAATIRYGCERIFARHDGEIIVELHWRITPRRLSFPLDTECLWGRLQRGLLGGSTVLNLSPEDTLLILCAHGAKPNHRWERLGWICDVAELLRVCQEDIAWERLLARASALGGERMLLLGLALASDLPGVNLPEKVSQRVKIDSTVEAIAGQIRKGLFREDNGRTTFLEGSYFSPFYLRTRERLADKIRYCVRTAMTQTLEDWEFLPLPKALFSFYHALRLIRLTEKYGRRLLERFP